MSRILNDLWRLKKKGNNVDELNVISQSSLGCEDEGKVRIDELELEGR